MNEQTYEVKIILNVTATNKSEALKFAVDDINELFKDGTLEADIEVLED